MSPSNLRNDHILANADSFNASVISTEFPKRINPFLKDITNFDELNGNQESDEDLLCNNNNNNTKHASSDEPAAISESTELIDEMDEGIEEVPQVVIENNAAEIEQTSSVEATHHDDTVDEENNSSKLLQESDGRSMFHGMVWIIRDIVFCFQSWRVASPPRASMRTFQIGPWLANQCRSGRTTQVA